MPKGDDKSKPVITGLVGVSGPPENETEKVIIGKAKQYTDGNGNTHNAVPIQKSS